MREGRSCSARRLSERIGNLLYCRWWLLPDERHVTLERPPNVHVSRHRVGLLAVDEQLHALRAVQVGADRGDDRIGRGELGVRAAGMVAGDVGAEIDEGVSARREIERLER